MGRKLRVVIAKCGLDGHDRGAKLVSRVLAEAGVEVIYTGKFQTPEQVVVAAIQEDVDGIGVSLLSGSHMTVFPKILQLLKSKGAESIKVFGGGTIMPDDIDALTEMGVDRIFPSDSPTDEIEEYVRTLQRGD